MSQARKNSFMFIAISLKNKSNFRTDIPCLETGEEQKKILMSAHKQKGQNCFGEVNEISQLG